MNWLGFTNPWMLLGLAAAGLPVLIHFLTRARPRRIPFPPLRFLHEAGAGQQAVHRLRTLVLLTLRCLAVLALVLLFTRPFLKPAGSAAPAATAQRVVLVLDASLSMRAVYQGVTLFARSQSEAADVLRGLDSGTEAAIILAGATPRPLLPALSRNLPALHDELVRTEPTFENGDPAAALALAQRLLGGTGTIYVFSDFQKANWEPVHELPGGCVCRLRPATTAVIDNVALTAARLAPAEPFVGEPAQLVCSVFNCASRPREEVVRLELGDSSHETRVALPAFGTADAVFNLALPRAGAVIGNVSLQPDNLREDNIRTLAVRVSKALQILLVSDADPADTHSAAFYISRALTPSTQSTPGLSLVRRNSQDTDRGILETADVFVLVAPALMTGEALEIISRRVREGAHALVFLDGPTSPSLLPAALNPPFRLGQTVTSDAGDIVSAGPRRLLGGEDAGDFTTARFQRHFRNQLLPDRAGEVVLTYADGSAALTLGPAGQGGVVFANLPLTPDAGEFIGSPNFPVLLHELLRALRLGSEQEAVAPGVSWTLDVPAGGDGGMVVTDPADRPVDFRVVASGRTVRLALPSVRVPGPYVVRQADAIIAAAAVNVDPRESDTRPAALEAFKSGPGGSVSVARGEDELLITGRARPLWPHLAAAATSLLSLEMLLLALWRKNVRGQVAAWPRPDREGDTGHRASAVANPPTEVVR